MATRISQEANHSEQVNVAPFQIKDCALIVRISDQLPAINLRELRERITSCPVDSIYHHFCETVLRPSFDDPEFHNDFAKWARHSLHDHVLAERLEIIDPYAFPNMEELRKEILDILADRLSEIYYIPWAQNEKAFYFHTATTVIFDTNQTIDSPQDLKQAIADMTTSSLYYHFWEARRRTPSRKDDFSVWLEEWNDRGEAIIEAFSHIDFFFMNLRELQAKLCATIENVLGK
jgi:hypothetical protein